jgi:Gene product 88
LTKRSTPVTSNLLKFNRGNAKLGRDIWTFSLPAGYACPGALECLSKANRDTGKITDGSQTKFRCFAASDEAQYKNTREQRWHNFNLLKNKSMAEMSELIQASLPRQAGIIRVHVSGDFFNQFYFDAWMHVARCHPLRTFYAYTKSLPFWVRRIGDIPKNFALNASRGGVHDELIQKHDLKYAEVVFSIKEAVTKKLEIDHDDSHAYKSGKPFALLIHGTQPAGSLAAKALSALRKLGWHGYGKKTVTVIALCLAMMDCVPDKFWPVWARPGNENIFSKIKIFGEELV